MRTQAIQLQTPPGAATGAATSPTVCAPAPRLQGQTVWEGHSCSSWTGPTSVWLLGAWLWLLLALSQHCWASDSPA